MSLPCSQEMYTEDEPETGKAKLIQYLLSEGIKLRKTCTSTKGRIFEQGGR